MISQLRDIRLRAEEQHRAIPIGNLAGGVLAQAARRSLEHWDHRSSDTTLSDEQRAEARREAESIRATLGIGQEGAAA